MTAGVKVKVYAQKDRGESMQVFVPRSDHVRAARPRPQRWRNIGTLDLPPGYGQAMQRVLEAGCAALGISCEVERP